jgi:hypothetical protein
LAITVQFLLYLLFSSHIIHQIDFDYSYLLFGLRK